MINNLSWSGRWRRLLPKQKTRARAVETHSKINKNCIITVKMIIWFILVGEISLSLLNLISICFFDCGG
jgi:hypothetical protein